MPMQRTVPTSQYMRAGKCIYHTSFNNFKMIAFAVHALILRIHLAFVSILNHQIVCRRSIQQ